MLSQHFGVLSSHRFDAIAYHAPALSALTAFADPDKIMFGTDHPFFRPHVTDDVLDKTTWPSPEENLAALSALAADRRRAIAYENGLAAFGVTLPTHMHPVQAT